MANEKDGLTISAVRARRWGGGEVSTGWTKIEGVPPGFVLMTESGRLVSIGDTIAKSDGAFVLMPRERVTTFVRSGNEVFVPLAFSVLLPVARALFGWLS